MDSYYRLFFLLYSIDLKESMARQIINERERETETKRKQWKSIESQLQYTYMKRNKITEEYIVGHFAHNLDRISRPLVFRVHCNTTRNRISSATKREIIQGEINQK